MKICMFADPHWCSYSSIVTSRGEVYSTRLEYLIKSMNFVEDTARKYDCASVFCLGDFFDKAVLNSEEITSLTEINWSDMPHVFIVGNHEVNMSDVFYNSAQLFNLIPSCTVIDKPIQYELDSKMIAFLPYIGNNRSYKISDYLDDTTLPRVIFSHNNIKGVQLGKFISTDGFDINDIENNCDWFFNGHLHNTGYIGNSNKILNIGNLCGQNFSEDAFKYKHCVYVFDTDTFVLDAVVNPYALNFYKLDLVNDDVSILNSLQNNVVCTIKCKSSKKDELKKIFSNVVASRFIIENDAVILNDDTFVSVDHYKQFEEFVLSKFGEDNPKVLDELQKVIAV